jgi:hypothetical protein
MKLFELQRKEDETGVSGTGTVAQGVIFDNGKVCLTWLTKYSSVAVYDSIEEVIQIHGHDGKTLVVQVCHYHADRARHLYNNMQQDICEGIACDFTSKNHSYMWEQREMFAEMFRQQQFNTGNASETQTLMQCRALGWWCQDGHGSHHRYGSFCPCDENDPGAMPDKNRLAWFQAHGEDTLYDGCDRVPRGQYKEHGGMVKGSK